MSCIPKLQNKTRTSSRRVTQGDTCFPRGKSGPCFPGYPSQAVWLTSESAQ